MIWRTGILMAVILQVAVLFFMTTACAENAAEIKFPDIWAPWRRPARFKDAGYTVDKNPVRIIPHDGAGKDGVTSFHSESQQKKMTPFRIDLSAEEFSDKAGIELTMTFRVLRIPPGRLESSHSLASFLLAGSREKQTFWLHAYSGNSGFMLNGFYNRKPKWSEVRLLRGAALPHSAVRWDTQWHTVKLACCKGQLAIRWDGLPILHAIDSSIDFSAFSLDWAKPGIYFHTIEFKPVEVRRAHFEELSLIKK